MIFKISHIILVLWLGWSFTSIRPIELCLFILSHVLGSFLEFKSDEDKRFLGRAFYMINPTHMMWYSMKTCFIAQLKKKKKLSYYLSIIIHIYWHVNLKLYRFYIWKCNCHYFMEKVNKCLKSISLAIKFRNILWEKKK